MTPNERIGQLHRYLYKSAGLWVVTQLLSGYYPRNFNFLFFSNLVTTTTLRCLLRCHESLPNLRRKFVIRVVRVMIKPILDMSRQTTEVALNSFAPSDLSVLTATVRARPWILYLSRLTSHCCYCWRCHHVPRKRMPTFCSSCGDLDCFCPSSDWFQMGSLPYTHR